MPEQSGFEQKKLGFAYWYVSNKLFFKNIIVILFVILNFLLIAYVLFYLIYNFGINRENYHFQLGQMIQHNPDYERLGIQKLPQPIITGEIQTFVHGEKYDILAEIANPNLVWWTEFDYQFRINDELTEKKSGFILPGETKNLMELLVEENDLAPELVISNINWQKEIDFLELYNQRFNFQVENIEFISANQLGLAEDVSISRLEFDVMNETAYDYRTVKFLIYLKSGNKIAAVNQTTSGMLKSLEKKHIEVNFFQKLPNITSVEVIPEVNIFDQGVYF